MFGASRHFYVSDRALGQAGPLIDALCLGRSPEEVRAVGASIDPWQMALDGHYFQESRNGPLRIVHGSLTLPAMAARHGQADLVAGFASRPDFFSEGAFIEGRDSNRQHDGRSLAESCMLEALSRGRLDILQILARAARAFGEAAPADAKGWIPRPDLRLLSLRRDDCDLAIQWICNAKSPASDAAARRACFDWVASMAEEGARAGLESEFLRIACAAGSPPAIEAALSTGAAPTELDVAKAADMGALGQAAAMAPKAQPSKARRGRFGEEPQSLSPICAQMADSHLRCLDGVADGALSWRDPEDSGREITWACYSDNKESLLSAQLMALRGALDLPSDAKAALASGKAALASAARAMSLLHPDPQAARGAVDAACSEAGIPTERSAQELLFLARMGSSEFAAALAESPEALAASACGSLCKLHQKGASSLAALREHPRRNLEGRVSCAERADANLREALYRAIDLGSALGAQAQALLADEAARAGLAAEFERRALGSVSAPGARARGPLKA